VQLRQAKGGSVKFIQCDQPDTSAGEELALGLELGDGDGLGLELGDGDRLSGTKV
jgi:hypothetical protein